MTCKACIHYDVCFIRFNNDKKDCYKDEHGTVCGRFVEDKRGEWIIKEDERHYEKSHFKCSKCGFEATNDKTHDSEMKEIMIFCMHCGARMDGKEMC